PSEWLELSTRRGAATPTRQIEAGDALYSIRQSCVDNSSSYPSTTAWIGSGGSHGGGLAMVIASPTSWAAMSRRKGSMRVLVRCWAIVGYRASSTVPRWSRHPAWLSRSSSARTLTVSEVEYRPTV